MDSLFFSIPAKNPNNDGHEINHHNQEDCTGGGEAEMQCAQFTEMIGPKTDDAFLS
jgi:hypothetical protein